MAVDTHADLAILMSDVDGIYNKPPAEEDARVIHEFGPKVRQQKKIYKYCLIARKSHNTENCLKDTSEVAFGEKSESGTGGMESKVQSALWAMENGSSVVICNGMKYNTIRYCRIFLITRQKSCFTC